MQYNARSPILFINYYFLVSLFLVQQQIHSMQDHMDRYHQKLSLAVYCSKQK